MIDRVYQELVAHRTDLVGRLNIFQDDLDKKNFRQSLKTTGKRSPPPLRQRKKMVAVDGGEFVKEMRTGALFILNGEALIIEGVNVLDTDQEVKTGVFRPGNKAKDRLESSWP